ncbi:hypothetical protein ACWD04_33605 [Streptomyces sp. NPDC002911]
MGRHGQTAVHLPAALLNSTLLVALPLVGPHGGPALAPAIVIAAGLSTPPLEASLMSARGAQIPQDDRATSSPGRHPGR